MNDGGVWTKESLEWLKANCQLKPHDMQDTLKEQFGVEPALQTIRNEVTKARREAREQSDAIAAEIDRQIQEHVRDSIEDYWQMMDDNIRKTNDILKGNDPDYKIPLDNNEKLATEGKLSNFWYAKYSRLLSDQIEKAFALRPEPRDINVQLDYGESLESRMAKYVSLFEKERDA